MRKVNRTIRFRGKVKNDGTGESIHGDGWVYGGCIIRDADDVTDGGCYIITGSLYHVGNANHVEPDSVGQYTGLHDKNGKDIYEGDILSGMFLFSIPIKGTVVFRDGAFGVETKRGDVTDFTSFTSICNVKWEIIGNTTDGVVNDDGQEN